MTPNDASESGRRGDERPDAALVDAANRGDPEAFASLYRRYRDWVFNLALRLTRDQSLALDVTQEVFMFFLRQFPGFELRSQLKTYLYPIVRHVSISLQQKQRSTHLAGTESTSERPQPSDDWQPLVDAVADLPPAQREVIHLRFADELTLAEIAEALHVPLGTVKSRLHHAIEALGRDPRTQNLKLD